MANTSHRVLVTREVEQYSKALREASAIARLDNQVAVVWRRELGQVVDYRVVGEGVNVTDGFVQLVKVAPVSTRE